MVWWGVRQHQPEKLAERKRVSRPPRNRTLGTQAVEIPDQQRAEAASRRQPRPTIVRVESLAQSFDVPIEVGLVEDLVQSRVERVRGTPRQILGYQPNRGLPRVPFFVCPSPSATVEYSRSIAAIA
jgi:hypothetical protein